MRTFLCTLYIILFATPTIAQVTGYVDSDNPDNSNEWRTAVKRLGCMINENVDFELHPPGALDDRFYESAEGVTLTPTGDISGVTYGEGPGQGNVTSTPLSTGEGKHPASNYLADDTALSTLTVTFDQPVFGAGIFVIDNYNPSEDDPILIEAFTGPDGTGTSLGEFSSEAFNFQKNYMHFVGIVSDAGDIRSVVFTDVDGGMSDRIGYDNLMFATDPPPIPLPGPMAMTIIMPVVVTIYLMRKQFVNLNL